MMTKRNESVAATSCPKCDSARWMKNVELGPHGNALYVTLAGWVGWSKRVSTLQAHVCGTCGYTELYADQPDRVWETWQKRQV